MLSSCHYCVSFHAEWFSLIPHHHLRFPLLSLAFNFCVIFVLLLLLPFLLLFVVITCTQTWKLANVTPCKASTNAYVSLDNELATCRASSISELLDDHGGDGGQEGGEGEHKPEPVPSFAKVYAAFQTVKSFFYVHNIGERDEKNILNIERAKQLPIFLFLGGGGGGGASDLNTYIKITFSFIIFGDPS
jgi:hypothetical protein